MTQIEALLDFSGEAVTPFMLCGNVGRLQGAGFEEVQRFDPAP
ncbi:MAG: hypothetical protein CM15mP103_04790 [Gammaproteobacteria bacterium]|nr:MAG: hypothetical protein CM15mP103_04790 [Gammaproteobacteria bacterium]